MPEFYADTACSYQVRAQPFLDAIARGIRDRADARNFVLRGTAFQASFDRSIPLWIEQWSARDPSNRLKCPFWANYWSNPCEGCTCRLAASVSMEIDALFFLRSPAGEGLAIHVEMKMPREPLSFGQAEAYRPRATCYSDERRKRKGVLPHQHFIAVIFAKEAEIGPAALGQFDRAISHREAAGVFEGYPILD